MKKNTEEKITDATELVNVTSGVLSILNPMFSCIPIFTYTINRVTGYVSEDNIVNRMKKIEKQLYIKRISLEEFKEKIINLTEHNEYIVRKNLVNILMNCIPESVDIYISVLIDLVMSQENSIHEEICEILSQLNKNDLTLLSKINIYREKGKNRFLSEHLKNNGERIVENYERADLPNDRGSLLKRFEFSDRDNIYSYNTIFWKDFTEMFNVSSIEIGQMLLNEGVNEKGEPTMYWAFLARSFIKLERLGLIQMDIQNTLGTINFLNVDRFHITLFGNKMLYYIDINETVFQ